MSGNPYLDTLEAQEEDGTTPVPRAAGNPYLATLNQQSQNTRAQAALAISTQLDQNPDKASQNTQLARRFKVPPAVVDQWPEEFRTRAVTDAAREALGDAPTLSRTLAADPRAAANIHDDVPMTVATEKTARSLPQRALDYVFSTHGITDDASENLASFAASVVRSAAATVEPVAVHYPALAAGALTLPVDWMLGTDLASYPFTLAYRQGLLADQEKARAAADKTFSGKLASATGGTLGVLGEAMATGGEATAARLGAGTWEALWPAIQHGIRSMLVPSAAASAETAQQVRDAGGTPGQAVGAGLASYASNTLGGIVPFAKAGAPLLSRIASGAAMGPITGEVSRQLMNATLPESMQTARPGADDLAIQAITGGVFGGLVGGHDEATQSRVMREYVRSTYDAANAHDALQAEATLRSLSAIVQEGKLRSRDMDSFKQLLTDVGDDANIDGVWIDARKLTEVLDAAGLEGEHLREVLPKVASQMREALQTEGQVRIGLDDYGTHIMGSTVEDALIPHLRVKEDGPTIGEAQKYAGGQRERMAGEAARILAEKAADEDFAASRQKVLDDTQAQLAATGRFPPDVAKLYANLHADWFTVLGAELGLKPHEARERYAVNVAGERGTGASVMDQPGAVSVEGYHFSHEDRPTLSTAAYGTGLRGSARDEILNHPDQRLRQRLSFYFDKGTGVRPEDGVGGRAHRVQLDNIYDADADPLKLRSGDARAFESKLLDLGYKGYLNRMEGTQPGQVIALGPQTFRPELLGAQSKIEGGQRVPALPAEAPTWRTEASGSPEAMQARLERMKANPAWAGYDLRVEGRELQSLKRGPVDEDRNAPPPAVFQQHADQKGLTDGPAAAPGAEGLPRSGELPGGAGVLAGEGRPDQGAGREPDGSLRGLPRDVGGYRASAFPEAQRVARDYMAKAGLPYEPPATYAKVDVPRAKRIAQAFEAMKHDPENPEVKAAYAKMVEEVTAQYQAALDAGLKVEFVTGDDPYKGNPRAMTEDVRQNNHMWVFSTRDGFGTDATFDPAGNPLLAETAHEISGQKALANDLFRVVHDYFGHVKEGVGFRAAGEENAWRAHMAMFSPLARKAATTETRGQNSWLNYGPHGETNRTAKVEDTHFADQKIGLLPDWVVNEGRTDAPQDAHINVGMDVRPDLRDQPLKVDEITDALRAAGVHVLDSAVHQSDTEKTFVGHLDRPLTPEEGHALSVALKQEAIAQKTGDTGALYGPEASKWGGYNPDYFLMPDGRRASDTTFAQADLFPEDLADKNTTVETSRVVSSKGATERGTNTNSAGQRIASTVQGLRNFWRWFGNSDAVDADGAPLVLYHSTNADTATLEANRKTTNNYGILGDVDVSRAAVFLTPDRAFSQEYLRSGEGQNVMPVYARMEYPFDLRKGLSETQEQELEAAGVNTRYIHNIGHHWELFDNADDGTNLFVDTLKRLGYDGALFREADQAGAVHDTYAVFSGEQVKSATGNRGTFDASAAVHNQDTPGGGSVGTSPPGSPDPLKPGAGARGQISFADDITSAPSTISLLKNADLSTFLHETGHFFLQVYADVAGRPDAPAKIAADMQHLLDWFGVKDVATWQAMTADQQREFHERFARGFEAYLMGGEAPSLAQQSMFQRFASWLTQVYRSLAGLNVQLTPEVRGVMDRMLASENAIKEAEAARGLRSLFETRPEGMTDDAWAKYQTDALAATGAAVSDLQRRSIKDMQWLANAKAGAMSVLQREAREKRKAITAEVTAEVDALPAFAAKAYLDRATDPLGDYKAAMAAWREQRNAVAKDERPAWLAAHPEPEKPASDVPAWEARREAEQARARDEEKARVGEGLTGIAKGQALAKAAREIDNNVERTMIAWDRANPRPTVERPKVDLEVTADRFGFNSADEMLQAIKDAGSRKDVIEAMTDQRMLERHGELVDPVSIERAAEAAIHNDVRARVLARELNALAKATGSPRLLAKAAEEAAQAAIGAKVIKDLRAKQYGVAEGKAGRLAMEAFKKGDTETAAIQKRAQLLNNALMKEALAAADAVRKGLTYQGKFDRASVRENLDGEFLEQIDRLRSLVDFRRNAPAQDRQLRSLLEFGQALRAQGYEPQVPDWLAGLTQRTRYDALTVDQFRGVIDAMRSLEHIARDRQRVRLGAERATVRDVVDNQLLPRLEQRGEAFSKVDLLDTPQAKVDGFWKAFTHWMGVKARLIHSDLLGADYRFNKYDLHDLQGPFRQLILDRFLEANYRKVDLTKAVSDRAGAVGDALGKDWQRSLYDVLPNRTLMDPDLTVEGKPPVPLKMTRGKLLAIARHVGNESNFDKLVKGWGWQPDTVVAYLKEHMRAADWQATQAHWDSFDPLWKETEAMVRRVGGVPPPKVPAREFSVTTKDGQTINMRGGYSPIDYDPVRSKLSVRKGEFSLDPSDKVENMPRYTATTTSNGSLNARAQGYTDRVSLDFHGADARIRDTIHDLAYREALIDATKIINDKAFREKFMSVYGREEYQALVDWMRSIRDTNVQDPRTRNFDKAMQYTRQGVVLTGIGYRVSTVLKHGGAAALKSLGYLGNADGAAFFAARLGRMGSGHAGEDIAAAKEKFDEIRARALQMDRDYKEGSRSMYEAEGLLQKNDRFGHAMVAWSDLLSAVPTAWAAYDLATTKGIPKSMGGTGVPMGEAEAVRYANSIVRQAHGSALEVSRSNFLQSRGAKGFFGALYGFMNNTYGQMADLLDKSTSNGFFRNNPAVAARLLATFLIPAVWTEWLKEQGPEDGHTWLGWLGKALVAEGSAMVPFVRDAVSILEYGRNPSVAPAQAFSDVLNAGKDLWKEAHGESTRLIQDLSNAIGEWAHIAGLGQLGHILQHMRDVANGKKEPSAWHAVVGGKEEHK